MHTLTAWNDDTHSMILDFLAQYLGDFWHVLGQWNNCLQVLLSHAKTTADGFNLVGAGRILTTSHTCCQVVADDDGDVSTLIDGIQQTGHA